MAEKNILDLPPEVLQLILSRLDIGERKTVLLVSKSLVPLSNELVREIRIIKLPSRDSEFRKIFARFPNATRISFSGRIGNALYAIGKSNLKIEKLIFYEEPRRNPNLLPGSLGDVKALNLSWDTDRKNRWKGVVDFIIQFPSLEELDLSPSSTYGWTDAEIVKLAANVCNLRKISLFCNKMITDTSLDALSSCVNLEHVSLKYLPLITVQGFCSFIRSKRKNLKSLGMTFASRLIGKEEDDIQTIAETVSSCQNLCHLSLGGSFADDTFFSVIANSRIPLTSLELKTSLFDRPCSMTGLKDALCAFQGLTRLHLFLEWYEEVYGYHLDEDMSQLMKCFPHLRVVSITSYHSHLATLFSLIHNCPLLESINLSSYKHFNCVVPQLARKNCSIQHIRLHCPMSDMNQVEAILKPLCPNAKVTLVVRAIGELI